MDKNVAPFSRPISLPISSAHSMNTRKYVHAQKPYHFQVFGHELSKVGRRKSDRKDRGQGADRKEAAQQNKNTFEELKQGLPAQLRLTKLGQERPTSPSPSATPPHRRLILTNLSPEPTNCQLQAETFCNVALIIMTSHIINPFFFC